MIFPINALIRRLVESGLMKKGKVDIPIISFGNIHYGGTGKTPHVIEAARILTTRGKKVCVLTRGYRRKGSAPVFIGGGAQPGGYEEIGDEPFLIKKRVNEVSMVVTANRFEGIKLAKEMGSPEIFLLDDGFQQFHLEKDQDFLLIPFSCISSLSTLREVWKLRELPGAMRYATSIIVTKVPPSAEEEKIDATIEKYAGEKEVFLTRYRVTGLIDYLGKLNEEYMGEEYFVFGGIGDFPGFLTTASSLGLSIGGSYSLGDHVEYTEDIIKRIRAMAGGMPLLTTEKDLVKLPAERFGPIYALRVIVEFVRGREEFETRLFESTELS